MTTVRRLLATLSCAAVAMATSMGPRLVRAENADLQLIKGGGTPAAIQGIPSRQRLSCPLLVQPKDAALQPLSLDPGQVEAKNRLGCLSSNDAVYGADGCPQKLCGSGSGVIPLPKGVNTPATPQLPGRP